MSSRNSHHISYQILILIRRTEALAKENGCTHTYAIVSSKYSSPVFDRLGHTMVISLNTFYTHGHTNDYVMIRFFKNKNILFIQVKSLAYADFVDNRGELLLKDTREHPEARVYYKAL